MYSNSNDWNDLKKLLEDSGEKLGKVLDSTAKDLGSAMKKEHQKMEVKSKIGTHQRTLNQAYEALGKAYYQSRTEGTEMPDQQEVLDQINSELKVIDLLKEQLETMEQEGK